MNIIKKILIPFDFSETSLNALRYAISFANDEDNLELSLLHVVSKDLELQQNKIEEDFENILVTLRKTSESNITYKIDKGELISTITKHQKGLNANMIIMGTHGSNEQENTNASALIKRVDCSVIIVPNTYNSKFKLNKIAVTLDKERVDDSKVLNILLDTTRRFNAEVHALTILTDDSSYSEADESNENLLQYYLENFYSHHSFPKGTDIEKAVFDYVKKHKIDMLCILPRHHSHKNQPSEGKLVSAFTKHTNLPLLILD